MSTLKIVNLQNPASGTVNSTLNSDGTVTFGGVVNFDAAQTFPNAISSLTAGTGLSGGVITTTGTIALIPATNAVIGGVKPDGTTITVAVDGTISATSGSGTVTSVVAGTGLLGGTITTTGTIDLDTAYTDTLYLGLAGGAMTGDITFSGTQSFPAQDLDTVTSAGNTTANSIDVGGLTAAGLIYPAADGVANEVIATDGAGNLGWAPGLPDYSLAAPPQILGLDSGTGDPAWTSTLPFVAPPNLSSDPGTVGECAFDNVYFYMHDGIQWNRVAWDTTPW